MPRGDGRGPDGFGPMTGRGMGYCAGFESPGYANPGYGRGMGYRRGGGYKRGYRRFSGYPVHPATNYNYAAPPAGEEKEIIENQIKNLQNQISNLEKRLAELNEE
ncbi:MAG: DUF5320 domain-containing protein [Candidatus Cloacimonadota bacterium]|nr:DUF5320 domain-containing protein [Candidatus Cloacimonadota bacterium]